MFHMRFHWVNKTLRKKKSCNSICCSCENNVRYLLEKSQLQLYYKAVAIHWYCLKRVYIFFCWVTHLKIIHSTFVNSSWHLFLKLWPEDRKFSAAKVGCSRSDQQSSWRCACPGACEQGRYLMELVRCEITNNWIFFMIEASKGRELERPLEWLNFKYGQDPHGLNFQASLQVPFSLTSLLPHWDTLIFVL